MELNGTYEYFDSNGKPIEAWPNSRSNRIKLTISDEKLVGILTIEDKKEKVIESLKEMNVGLAKWHRKPTQDFDVSKIIWN